MCGAAALLSAWCHPGAGLSKGVGWREPPPIAGLHDEIGAWAMAMCRWVERLAPCLVVALKSSHQELVTGTYQGLDRCVCCSSEDGRASVGFVCASDRRAGPSVTQDHVCGG